MNAPRDFHADLAMSNHPAVVEGVIAAIKRCFPEALNVTQAHTENDRLGIDYWLEFPGGRMETLDAKIRKQDYSLPVRGNGRDDRTACIELLSNVGTKKPGWTVDTAKRTDWILFFYIESGKGFLYNARQLRAAVIRYLPELRTTGKPGNQSTGGYQSESLFVSHRELSVCIYRNSQLVLGNICT
jgi:hypothetical protein